MFTCLQQQQQQQHSLLSQASWGRPMFTCLVTQKKGEIQMHSQDPKKQTNKQTKQLGELCRLQNHNLLIPEILYVCPWS
jgi:hypothetical protein